MKLIPLSQNGTKQKGKHFAIVDDEDYEDLVRYRWSYSYGYAARSIKRNEGLKNQTIRMHRQLIKGLKDGEQIDHKDRDKLNNQKNNLRVCNQFENQRNTCSRKNSSSKYLGVHYYDRSKENRTSGWKATLRVDNKQHYLGMFQVEEDAAKAYDKAAVKYFKEFASLNFK